MMQSVTPEYMPDKDGKSLNVGQHFDFKVVAAQHT